MREAGLLLRRRPLPAHRHVHLGARAKLSKRNGEKVFFGSGRATHKKGKRERRPQSHRGG